MIYNNEIIIELYLLNFGVLMIPQEPQEKVKPTKTNQVADNSMKKSASSKIQAYTYWEVLGFKMLTCCKKKSSRYRQYRKHKEVIEDRMDIVNFISNESYATLLSKLLMKPYQLKMASHLKTTTQKFEKENQELTMEEAIE